MAYSVAASQHSVMTSGGAQAEHEIARHIIASHPNQIVSLVADSYDYYAFVDAMIAAHDLVTSNGVRLVIRPDSITPQHRDPESVVVWTLNRLHEKLGSTTNSKGFRVVPYGVLWGDGIDAAGIARIVAAATSAGYAVSNLVFGMGGGLLQKDINSRHLPLRHQVLGARRRARDGRTCRNGRSTSPSDRRPGRFSLVRLSGRTLRDRTLGKRERSPGAGVRERRHPEGGHLRHDSQAGRGRMGRRAQAATA